MSQTKRSWVDYRFRAFQGEMYELNEVSDLIEKNIQRGFDDFGRGIPEDDIQDFIDCHYDELVLHRNTYPTFLRGSLLVTTCSLVEKELNSFAEALLKQSESGLKLKDFAGQGIQRAKLCIEKACGRPFPSNTLAWQRIINVHDMRSVVLHSGWEIESAKNPEKTKRRVENIVGIDLSVDGFVSISSEFYPAHKEHLLSFFRELFVKDAEA